MTKIVKKSLKKEVNISLSTERIVESESIDMLGVFFSMFGFALSFLIIIYMYLEHF